MDRAKVEDVRPCSVDAAVARSGTPDVSGATDQPPRVLRLKLGYNPNSSSLGSVVFGIPFELLVGLVVFGGAAGAAAVTWLQRQQVLAPSRDPQRPEPAPDPAPAVPMDEGGVAPARASVTAERPEEQGQ